MRAKDGKTTASGVAKTCQRLNFSRQPVPLLRHASRLQVKL
jgi:hypothetical protein